MAGQDDREDDAHAGMADGGTGGVLRDRLVPGGYVPSDRTGGIAAVISRSIEFSPTRAKLMTARLAAQREFMKGAKRDRQNPFAKNTYATLEAVLEAVAEPLCEAGLVLTQWVGGINQEGKDRAVLTVYTRIEHAESSEYMQTSLPIPLVKHDAQGVGSAMTYGRRYTLKSLLGIPEVDDDGAAASGQESEIRPKRKSAAESKRDGTTELFNEIRKEIAEALNAEHLRHVGETRREELENMPDRWADLLREDYSVKLDELKARGT